MSHQLNIKGEEAYRLANELAALHGESLTSAVTRALRDALERERRERDVAAKVADVLALAKEIKAHLEPGTTSDHSWLYDEHGLPK